MHSLGPASEPSSATMASSGAVSHFAPTSMFETVNVLMVRSARKNIWTCLVRNATRDGELQHRLQPGPPGGTHSAAPAFGLFLNFSPLENLTRQIDKSSYAFPSADMF
jgi:hypothetical protein